MTRINVIPPRELTDKHLVAEYRELPRLFTLIEQWDERGRPGPMPEEYTLGKGHVRFFYGKAAWLAHRFDGLVKEMLSRGFKPQYLTQWHRVAAQDERARDWVPTHAAIAINRARIAERNAGKMEKVVQRTLDEIIAQARRLPFWIILPKDQGPPPDKLHLSWQMAGAFIRYPTDIHNAWCFAVEDDALRFKTRFGGRIMDAR